MSPWSGRWSPRTLGASLPIDTGLRRWQIGLAAAFFVVGAAIGIHLWLAQRPDVGEPLSDAATERLVAGRLARVELPAWNPGDALPSADAPAFPTPDPPPPWNGVPSWDRIPGSLDDELAQARAELDGGRATRAATRYLQVAHEAPLAWLPRYQAGLALLERGDERRAADELRVALQRHVQLSGGFEDQAGYLAARLATRQALARALIEDDCIEAIRQLKVAIGELADYVRAADVLVYDTDLPFTVEPQGTSSHALWLALVDAYGRCPRYPGAYMERYRGARSFGAEYSNADLAEVQSGPFATELTACIETARTSEHGESARCWALSNLNQLDYANRSAYPELATDGPGELPPGEQVGNVEHPEALARLAYAVAWTLADSEDAAARLRAHRYLTRARLLAREAGDRMLLDRVVALGRHLAPETGDYSSLAEPFRGRSAAALEPLDGRTPLETVKGIAWHLTERWRRMLAGGDTEEMLAEVARVRQKAGPYGASLEAWREEVRERLRTELVTTMREARDNGDLAVALALRDLEAPYLGSAWESAAARGWRPWNRWALWLLAWLAWGLLLLALYRLVVVPYHLYTTDFYREEYRRREEAARREQRPFTREEIERAVAGGAGVRSSRPTRPGGRPRHPGERG